MMSSGGNRAASTVSFDESPQSGVISGQMSTIGSFVVKDDEMKHGVGVLESQTIER